MKCEDYCITTVAVGDKYRRMLDVFMKSYCQFDNMPQMLVVSESPDLIKHNNILTTNIGDNPIAVNGDFNMCLKRLAFQHAIDRGYEKHIFIDIDRTIESWDWDTIFSTTKSGFGTNWLRSYKPTKDNTSNIKNCKYNAIISGFNDSALFDMSFPVFGESLNIVSLPSTKIQHFVDTWSRCAEFISKSNCRPRHINVEMGVSLKLNNINIYKYDPPIETVFDGKIFKHYSYGKKNLMFKHEKYNNNNNDESG